MSINRGMGKENVVHKYNGMLCLVAQLCLTLWEPHGLSPPGSFVRGILPARILEWVAISFSKGSFWPKDQTWVYCIAGRFFTIWAYREVLQRHNAICSNMNEGRDCHTEWRQSDKDKCHRTSHIWNIKKKLYKWTLTKQKESHRYIKQVSD